MSKTDDYIIVTDARNLDEEGESREGEALPPKESQEVKDLSLRVLRMQGIFPEHEEGEQLSSPAVAHDEFSKELLKESGIEILKEDDENGALG